MTLLTERRDATLWLTLNRPGVHNALNAELLGRLDDALDEAAADTGVRAIVLTGAGTKAFSAGADLGELAGLPAERAHQVLARGGRIVGRLERSPVPVIAAVGGLALGGGFELALACSFIVAAERASFGLPETGLGLIPGYGGTQRLPRLIGRQAALHAILTGERITADRAYGLGMVAVPPVPREDLDATAERIAATVASRGPHASGRVLEAVASGLDSSLEAGLRLETGLAALCVADPEAAEGIAAFREHRAPAFTTPALTGEEAER
ncbi:enoyl-CoA hydratase-related protein [Actinoallomurus sp. NBC_01490]|uniref:enoyl-CoA hydratase/isomerase family protein n=1 Tax=Actinoallomurus sp. NBC_01490 TaxID=2903557 RepID=UPI002E3747E3|nr:enoyl-CoA hydratase-related protein [Actinoallomurus sp. NBC_01490]